MEQPVQATLTGALAPEPPRIQYPKGSRVTAQNACGTVLNAGKGGKNVFKRCLRCTTLVGKNVAKGAHCHACTQQLRTLVLRQT